MNDVAMINDSFVMFTRSVTIVLTTKCNRDYNDFEPLTTARQPKEKQHTEWAWAMTLYVNTER